MTALTTPRYQRRRTTLSGVELPGKTESVFQGGMACIDTSTGLVVKAFPSTTIYPIGVFTESAATPSGGKVHVTLNREWNCEWLANSAPGADAVTLAQVGSEVFCVDDNTVAKTSGSSTRSIAGRVWGVDSVKGVLIQSCMDYKK